MHYSAGEAESARSSKRGLDDMVMMMETPRRGRKKSRGRKKCGNIRLREVEFGSDSDEV